MNIDGLGDEIMEDFFNLGFVQTITDIYALKNHRKDLIELEGYGNKSVDNLLEAIENSKKNSVERLLFGLGIGGIGDKTALYLAKIFKNIDRMIEASVDDYLNIKDIGPTLAQNLYDYFHNTDNLNLINELKNIGINMEYINDGEKYHKFITGKKFVLTGTLSFIDRESLSALLDSYGASTSSSVSKNTDVVIVGDNPGSKYDKARSLGIEIWDEEEIKSIVSEL
jgi:DNA ligase (NAD+)